MLQTFRILHPDISVDVIGSSNQEWFGDNGAPLLIDFDGTYDIIVDLKKEVVAYLLRSVFPTQTKM